MAGGLDRGRPSAVLRGGDDGGRSWTWHSLRHVFCTTGLFTWRIEASDVSRLAAHSNVRITLDLYVGATAGVLDRARSAVAVLTVAGIAAYVSYWHACAVVCAHGESGITTRLEPATIDGLVYASGMVNLSPWPPFTNPSFRYVPASDLATQDLPVPAAPVKTMFFHAGREIGMPISARARSAIATASHSPRRSRTGFRPGRSSSSGTESAGTPPLPAMVSSLLPGAVSLACPEPDNPVQVLVLRDALGPGGHLGGQHGETGQAGDQLAARLGETVRQQAGQAFHVLVQQYADNGHGGESGFSGHWLSSCSGHVW